MRKQRESSRNEISKHPLKLSRVVAATSFCENKKTPRRIFSNSKTTKIVRPKTTQGLLVDTKYDIKQIKRFETTIDVFSDKFHATKSVISAQKVNDVSPEEWVVNYVKNKLANSAAAKIQTTWRIYKTRKKCAMFFNKRVFSRRETLESVFNGWRGYASHDIDTINKCYEKFISLQETKPWFGESSRISTFPLFYLSGRYFYPSQFNPRTFTYVVRTFFHPEGKQIFDVWRRVTASRRGYRTHCSAFLQTIRKRMMFGNVFTTFILWSRYTKWKKQSALRQDAFSLNCPEFIIEWRAWENSLNKRKAMKNRADEFQIKMIKKRANMAIHQNLVKKRQNIADLISSHNFYLRRLQGSAKRAWIKFIDIKKQQRGELLKLQRMWYTAIFEDVKKRFTFSTFVKYTEMTAKSSCFFQWKKVAKIEKLKSFESAVKFQAKPAIPRQFFFTLMKLDSLIIFEKSFKEWISFTRKRHAFKQFLETFKRRSQERETKEIAFYSLKRAADNNIIKRLVHQVNRFYPYKVMMSLEGTKKDYQRSTEEGFKFYTDSTPESSQADIFIRLVLLVIDNVKHFEAAKFSTKEDKGERPFTYGVASYDSLNNSYKTNCRKMRVSMNYRLQRDKAIINAFDAHTSAVEFSKVTPNFKANGVFHVVSFFNDSIKEFKADLDSLESIKYHLIQTRKEEYVPSEKIHMFIHDEKEKFKRRLRPPSIIYKQYENADIMMHERISQHQKSYDPNATRVNIIPFEIIKPQKEIPFKNPSIGYLKKMKNLKVNNDFSLISTRKMSLEIEKMKPRIEKLDPITSIKLFFFAATGIKLDIRNTEPPKMTPSVKRIYRRNVATFAASFMGIDASTSVPTGLDYSPVNKYIKAINGTFNSLSAFPSLFSFCGEIPFPEKLSLSSSNAFEVRHNIYEAAMKKFPKLDYKESSISGDEFSINDLMMAALILPYVFRPDFVREFTKEELRVTQTKE